MNLEILKYLVIGGLSTISSFIIFSICLYFLKINYMIALTIASLISIIFTYVMNFTWVFKPENRLRFQERFTKYLLICLVSFFLNLFVLHAIVSSTHYDPFYVQLAIMPPLVIINFLVTKYWSMKKYFTENTP